MKERPKHRGYVILVILAGLIFWLSLGVLHFTFARTAEIISGTLLVSAAFQLRHRGINREVRRRR